MIKYNNDNQVGLLHGPVHPNLPTDRWPGDLSITNLHIQPTHPRGIFHLREANFLGPQGTLGFKSFAINTPFIRTGSSMAVVATFGAIGTILIIVGWLGRELRSTVCRKGLILLLFQTRSAVSRQSFYKNGNKGTKKDQMLPKNPKFCHYVFL